MSETKNDKAWEKLFFKYKIMKCIKQSGCFEVTSSQINEFREARLMTKFDHKHNLPKLFVENNLSILPITRGSYLIAPFDAYHTFEQSSPEIVKLSFPDHIQSINIENVSSESTVLNCAYIAGILTDFISPL